MKIWILTLGFLLLSQNSFAMSAGTYRLGAVAGNVSLLQDVGAASGNGMGYGAHVGYLSTEELAFDILYTSSSHTNLNHTSLMAGATYYFNSYDTAYFYFTGGADFVNHNLTNYSQTSSSFGLYAGAGVDMEVGSKFLIGLVGTYNNIFATTIRAANGNNISAIQNYYTVFLKLTAILGNSK